MSHIMPPPKTKIERMASHWLAWLIIGLLFSFVWWQLADMHSEVEMLKEVCK